MHIQDNPPGEPDARRPIFRNTPPVLIGLAGLIIAISVFQFLAPEDTAYDMLYAGAVIGGPGADQLERPFGHFAPLALHTFLHGGILHLGLNMAAMFSFGAIVATVIGKSLRGMMIFLAFFFVCAIGGGLAELYVMQFRNEISSAIGASSAISGLLPALGWLQGGWKRALRISLPWFLINIGLAVLGGASPIPIAWAAHIGGLVAGFSFPLFLYWARPELSRR